MKKMLMGVAMLATLAVFPAVAHADHWKALAVYGDGWGFGQGASEQEARANAIFQCKLVNPDCSWGTSVQPWWSLVGIKCSESSFTAGSEYGPDQAFQNALVKASNAGDGGCDLFVQK
jgi:hypothetical protein